MAGMTRITSMSKVRFEELLHGIMDGSLSQQWTGKDEQKLTKREQVELRQLLAIANIYNENPIALEKVNKGNWKLLEILKQGDRVYLRLR